MFEIRLELLRSFSDLPDLAIQLGKVGRLLSEVARALQLLWDRCSAGWAAGWRSRPRNGGPAGSKGDSRGGFSRKCSGPLGVRLEVLWPVSCLLVVKFEFSTSNLVYKLPTRALGTVSGHFVGTNFSSFLGSGNGPFKNNRIEYGPSKPRHAHPRGLIVI